ncbi:MAG: hypothetical protein KF778_20085 [Rhodocyclaceae bacterium]|nr:hypothetical protein [Rhodocyclaceae bacterium]MBX3670709.1 hypothetical protein [Rhodocyclaceae bacterium]
MNALPFLLRDAEQIGIEIERKAVALQLDWKNEAMLRALAREAMDPDARKHVIEQAGHGDRMAIVKAEMFGLIALMERTMAGCADLGWLCHGDQNWKALGRALWAEKELRDGQTAKPATA